MKNRANETVSGTDGTAHANTSVAANEIISSMAGANTHADIQQGKRPGPYPMRRPPALLQTPGSQRK